MDIKRTILIVALAIVSYVMVLKWNQDYGQAALPTQNVAASNTAPSLPDAPVGNNAASNDDIPRAASDTSAPAEAPRGRKQRSHPDQDGRARAGNRSTRW
nr:hypothetical protein GCM10020185_33120 [Pseudomonas brassicacearum subsp. brassicacearum]